MQKIMQRICCLLLILFLTSCHTPGIYISPKDVNKPLRGEEGLIYPHFMPITPELFARMRKVKSYKVGEKDILTIIVWNHPELTIPSMITTSENLNVYNTTNFNDFTNNPPGILVDEEGEIFFPLAGRLRVAGLTVNQIRERLTNRLYEYFQKPQVSVRVAAFRNKYVYVVGEVLRQGILPITDMKLTIMDAINQSGGIDKEASDAHYIYVIRGGFQNPIVYWLDATNPGAMLLAAHFQLEPRDVLVISTAGVVRWSRVVNNILPTIRTFMEPPINGKTD